MSAGTSSFGMSGVNAHMLLANPQATAKANPISKQPTLLQWHRVRHFIVPMPSHLLQFTTGTPSQHQQSFSFRLHTPALAALYSMQEAGRPVLPPSVLLSMAAAASASLLDDKTALPGLSSIAFPCPAVLAAPATASIVLLRASLVSAEMALSSSNARKSQLLTATMSSGIAVSSTQPDQSPAASSALPSLLHVAPESTLHPGYMASMAPHRQTTDAKASVLAAALGWPRAHAVMTAASHFQPVSNTYHIDHADSCTHLHAYSSGLACTDLQMTSPSQGAGSLQGVCHRSAGSQFMQRRPAAEQLTYSIQMQAAATAPDKPARLPPGELYARL